MTEKKDDHKHTHDHTHEPVDFIEFDFTAWTEDGKLFDTTISDAARASGIEMEKELKPITTPLSPDFMLPGLYNLLKDKEPGKYETMLEPKDAFGKKDPKKMKLMNLSQFKKHDVNPQVGMDVEVNDMRGIVRSVSSGRVLVDFNHPMAGRTLKYEVYYRSIIDNPVLKLTSLLSLTLRIPESLYSIDYNAEDKKAVLKLKIPPLPPEIESEIIHMAEGMIAELDGLVLEYESKNTSLKQEN
ncbi:MAG: FKBP-type peptidyl-prolyl cis-trans isomerase [Candidatus Woesearchaeota archaeon]